MDSTTEITMPVLTRASGAERRPARKAEIRCSVITEGDLDGIADLYVSAFPYSRTSWIEAFKRLAVHVPPEGYPRYGYVMRSGGEVVGAIMAMHSTIVAGGQAKVRCSISNWYVKPAFRAVATSLTNLALRYPEVTYMVITPAPQVLPLLDVQGYSLYCKGRFQAFPALRAPVKGVRVEMLGAATGRGLGLPRHEADLLLDHLSYGCISMVCHDGGETYPFVFATRWKRGILPCATLIYCRDVSQFVQYAGNLGRLLMLRGFPLVIADANEAIPGLLGWYSAGYPKFYKGQDQPRLGDLAYSKRVFLGI